MIFSGNYLDSVPVREDKALELVRADDGYASDRALFQFAPERLAGIELGQSTPSAPTPRAHLTATGGGVGSRWGVSPLKAIGMRVPVCLSRSAGHSKRFLFCLRRSWRCMGSPPFFSAVCAYLYPDSERFY